MEVSRPQADNSTEMRSHSALATAFKCSGQVGMPDGLGSLALSGRRPGFPFRSFTAVGVGFLPTDMLVLPRLSGFHYLLEAQVAIQKSTVWAFGFRHFSI